MSGRVTPVLPISSLQHWEFCSRQAVLIHLENTWLENRLTAHGRVVHRHVHGGDDDWRGGVRRLRAVEVSHAGLGIRGVCDVVEVNGAAWCPLEYKRGRPKKHIADHIQVAAQAMCLEDMLGVSVPVGGIYYAATKRRVEVRIDGPLRERVETDVKQLREALVRKETPRAIWKKHCDRCSLSDLCLPQVRRDAGRWFRKSLRRLCEE